jgi:hypothetical protein
MTDRTTVSLRPRSSPRRSRRDRIIDRLRPLTYDAAGKSDLDIVHVHLFPEGARISLSLVTNTGTATFLMPPQLARELGDGLTWLSEQES